MYKPAHDALFEAALITHHQLQQAIRVQNESSDSFVAVLTKLGFVSESDIACALGEFYGLRIISGADYDVTTPVSDRLNSAFLRRNHVIPLTDDETSVDVALIDPSDEYLLDALALVFDKEIKPAVGCMSEIDLALERYYGRNPNEEAVVQSDGNLQTLQSDDVEYLKDLASEAPTIRMVNAIIAKALSERASDIHIEPFEGQLVVRYRIDGVLHEQITPPVSSAAAAISRIKVIAGLDIAERRTPQDGRIKMRIEGREVDMRISTVPTLYGESVVLRLLDQRDVPLDFISLGFEGKLLQQLEALLARPQGVLLVTGPTGSGKTTTLYAALKQLNTTERKILTIEDPVEYQMAGINQIPVQPKIDVTFAKGLRAILRQDPDIIMVGEIRDTETARIAVQAALTGHKVLSTLHTNDAPSSVSRLLDMQIDDFLLTSTVDGILAQRLVRRLCRHCKSPIDVASDMRGSKIPNYLTESKPPTIYEAVGCKHCDGTGYHGRTTISEMLVMSDAIKQLVIAHADADRIRSQALTEGMQSMRDDGLTKVIAGITTIEEVERVTDDAAIT